MFGSGWIGNDPSDHQLGPKCVAQPTTYKECEDRVRWVIEFFSDGEKALLYKLLYNEGLRRDDCDQRIKKLRGSFK